MNNLYLEANKYFEEILKEENAKLSESLEKKKLKEYSNKDYPEDLIKRGMGKIAQELSQIEALSDKAPGQPTHEDTLKSMLFAANIALMSWLSASPKEVKYFYGVYKGRDSWLDGRLRVFDSYKKALNYAESIIKPDGNKIHIDLFIEGTTGRSFDLGSLWVIVPDSIEDIEALVKDKLKKIINSLYGVNEISGFRWAGYTISRILECIIEFVKDYNIDIDSLAYNFTVYNKVGFYDSSSDKVDGEKSFSSLKRALAYATSLFSRVSKDAKDPGSVNIAMVISGVDDLGVRRTDASHSRFYDDLKGAYDLYRREYSRSKSNPYYETLLSILNGDKKAANLLWKDYIKAEDLQEIKSTEEFKHWLIDEEWIENTIFDLLNMGDSTSHRHAQILIKAMGLEDEFPEA